MRQDVMMWLVLCGAFGPTSGGEFDLSWHSIDGGGVIKSMGGDFELSGTIGQADAGTLTGGGLELTGGFWFEVAPTDCNDDGVVNRFDHSALAACLAGPANQLVTECACFDGDRTGTVDLRDFAVVQNRYSGP